MAKTISGKKPKLPLYIKGLLCVAFWCLLGWCYAEYGWKLAVILWGLVFYHIANKHWED